MGRVRSLGNAWGSAEESVWGDILHPESVEGYGRFLSHRQQHARLFHTGLHFWDKYCDDTGGGLDDFWYVVIGGASNVGKTQVLLALAQQALKQDFAVIFLSLEEPADQIQRRIYAALSDLNYYDFTYANWTEAKRKALKVPYLGKLVVNDDLEQFDFDSIMAHVDEARDLLTGRPCILMVDNLQLVHPRPGSNIAAAATELSEGLRRWAKKNRTLTIALSQLTADAIRKKETPNFAYLWGGSAMYSNPSQVIMLDHINKEVDPQHRHIVRLWMNLAKNRYGPNQVSSPVEANLRTGLWRGADPDEHRLWADNPWAK
jgi:KaiC/GvpD/RAD55 family RecA-like ATPase